MKERPVKLKIHNRLQHFNGKADIGPKMDKYNFRRKY
jgi:hypothetical protein